jgi:hypothetical protein
LSVESADAMLVELNTLFAPEPAVRSTKYFRRSELALQSVAIALAVVIVAATSLVAGTIVRVRTVPIEAVNLAPGLRIMDQSAIAAQVRLRGSLQSDIEAKWRDIRCIRDDIHLLMRSRAGSSAADSEAVRTITERLDRMLSTNRIVRETLLELRTAGRRFAQDLDDQST